MSTATTHIKTEKQLVPELRFKGFEDNWNKRKLKSFENKERKVLKAGPFGSAIKKEDYVPQGYKVYGQEQVIKGDPFYGSYFVDEKKFNQLKSCDVEPGDLLISLVGTFGKVLLIPENAQKGIINPRLLRISISNNEVLSNYLKCFFLTPIAIKSLIARSQGGTMGVLNGEIVGSIHIPFPSLPEQQKIASFLSAVDEKIQQLNKKKNLLEAYKKGVMQQLFSGLLRFKDENGNPYPDWAESIVSDFLKERKTSAQKGGEYEHISLTKSGVVAKSERYERDFLVRNDEKKYKITHLNDICYNPANLKFGVICRNSFGTGVFSPIYVTFEVYNADVSFVEYLVTRNDFIQKARKYEEGTVYERMAVKPLDFITLTVDIPCLEEQQKIATYLSSIDTKIESVSNQITQTQTLKKGLLQQMFIG